MSGMILFDTSRMIHGGETNYGNDDGFSIRQYIRDVHSFIKSVFSFVRTRIKHYAVYNLTKSPMITVGLFV